MNIQELPGGAVVKNLPANAGDMGLSPGPGRSHMPRSNKARVPQLQSLGSGAHEPQLLSLGSGAHEPQLLSLRSRAREPQLLSPRATTTEAHTPRTRAPQQEKPPQ